ncbi:hypothetical protein chiPu_0002906 [Chiloscyllium punctatum]|uniref:dual-specificity kinase n=1 Tax=Chiloscyllium punctatum TaxID=137246 RepID=A0A401S276_CHIPU|nr:hypothetical protein [Chiloscyllium punctatum]
MHFKNGLTNYEHEEILNFEEIWFLGLKAKKFECSPEKQHNICFDDKHGSYVKVLHDHIAYRYEILEVIGKGSFGQVVKCMDHKANELVAIKIIRDKKRIQQQAFMELKILDILHKKDKDGSNNIIHMKEYFYFRNHLCISFELLGSNPLRVMDPSPGYMLALQLGAIYTYIQSRFYRSPEVILGCQYGLAIDMWSFGCILAELYTGHPLFPGENEIEQLACIMEILKDFLKV